MTTPKRVALVTGCSRKMGIGAATVRALAAAGIQVVANSSPWQPNKTASIDGWQGVRSLASEITAAGGSASYIEGDVSSEADVTHILGEVLQRYGRLDVLINNAGAPQGRDRAAIEEVPLEAWEEVMAINARSVFLTCRATVAHMKKQRWGRIINISSSNAKSGGKHRAVYAASKAAVLGFTRSLALEVAADGITVNAICPGPILTDRALSTIEREWSRDNFEAGLAERNKRIPVGRHGTPDEVAAMIVYLASEQSGFVTGQALSICGGIT